MSVLFTYELNIGTTATLDDFVKQKWSKVGRLWEVVAYEILSLMSRLEVATSIPV